MVVDNNVYDLTEFQEIHPGGKKILAKMAGKDASKQFHIYHDKEKVMRLYGNERQIGSLASSDPATNPSSAAKNTATISKNSQQQVGPVRHKPFGDMVPYSDPAWYQSYFTPYYNDTHVALRKELRKWVDENVEPFADEWDQSGVIDPTLYKRFGQNGYLALVVGLKKYPVDYTDLRVKSVPVDQFDVFHELILTEELCRAGSGGLVWHLVGGFSIGIPPVFKFAKESVKRRVLPGILAGDQRICLSITEPDAGSDVANLTTTAEKTADGKYYVVNGTKKWITNGIWADYFTAAVRTGGSGMNGISVLLIEKSFPGVNVRKMETQGMRTSGSTYITFEDVKVPVENLIGEENNGFKVIMTNFNHERLGVIIQANRFARVCVEQSLKYAHQRKTFGKNLIDHDVIRNKIGQMASRLEAGHHWIESLLYQYKNMSENEAMSRLGGPIAACKAFNTQMLEFCAREASQIFGGLSYTRGGKGGKIERIYREVRAYAIPGGSEEIMLDLAIRQALRVHQQLGAKL